MSDNRQLGRKALLQADAMALIMAGGNGSRLGALTSQVCKPALSFAGVYRNIDFTLSNCVNSGLRRIAMLTQYNAHTLLHHITNNWSFLSHQMDEFVELWPAQKRTDDDWYQGTANAIEQNRDLIADHAPRYTVILGGDHIYKMDYGALLRFHQQRDADVTVGSIEVSLEEACQMGVMGVDSNHLIRRFDEKPKSPEPIPGCKDKALASMGIYVFTTRYLLDALAKDALNPQSSHDFGRDILPAAIKEEGTQIFAYPFRDRLSGQPGYWRDVGTIGAYWQAHMDLLDSSSKLDIYDQSWPVIGANHPGVLTQFLPGPNGAPSAVADSIVSPACVVQGARVNHSVLSTGVCIEADTLVENSVVLPNARIGRHCQLNRVIVDSDCTVPDGTVIDGRLDSDLCNDADNDNDVVLLTNDMLRRISQNPADQVA